MIRALQHFLQDEEGAVAIEYALVAAGIAAVVLAFFTTGGSFDGLLTSLYNKIKTAAGITT